MDIFHKKAILLFFTVASAFILWGQDTTAYGIDLPEIAISQSRIKEYKGPKFVSMDSTILSNNRGLALGDILQNTTGVFISSTENFSQDMRISIRGFGMRSAFGIRGIKLVLDGLPESTPDGQGDVDNIDPALLQSVSILKGPANGIYSNASGGVIEMKSLWPQRSKEASLKTIIGSNGLLRTNFYFGLNKEKQKLVWSFGGLKYAGYREHSAYTNYNFMLKTIFILKSGTLQLIANGFNSPKAEDAGGITLAQSEENPKSARVQNIDFNAGEQVIQQKLGAIFQHQYNSGLLWQTTGFISNRSFDNQLPFANGGQVSYERLFYGGNSTLGKRNLINKNDNVTIGLEVEHQKDDRNRFDNLKTGSGELRLHQDEIFSDIGLFTKYTLAAKKLNFTLNGRIEDIQLSLNDLFLSDGDASGKSHYTPLSGGMDINYNLVKHLSGNATLSSGFETPTLTEIGNNPMGGGFANIKPARTYNSEVGLNYQKDQFQISTNFFYTTSSNELIPYELIATPGRIFYRNGGKSLRKGLEINTSVRLANYLQMNIGGVINKMTFTNSNNDKVRLPGLPKSNFQVGINTMEIHHTTFRAMLKYQGDIFAEDANTIKIKPVYLSTFGLERNFKLDNFAFNVSVGGQYILSKTYYSNLFINAAGARYYEPGARTNLYASFKISFGK